MTWINCFLIVFSCR